MIRRISHMSKISISCLSGFEQFHGLIFLMTAVKRCVTNCHNLLLISLECYFTWCGETAEIKTDLQCRTDRPCLSLNIKVQNAKKIVDCWVLPAAPWSKLITTITVKVSWLKIVKVRPQNYLTKVSVELIKKVKEALSQCSDLFRFYTFLFLPFKYAVNNFSALLTYRETYVTYASTTMTPQTWSAYINANQLIWSLRPLSRLPYLL